LGDWRAGTDRGGLGLGYECGALVFRSGLAVVAGLYFWTTVSRTKVGFPRDAAGDKCSR